MEALIEPPLLLRDYPFQLPPLELFILMRLLPNVQQVS